ncbi:MAG: acyl carrier protein [Acidobacteria bacterium]|nr:MAG: acyl carrier protein [Acidobacteriota bacterium]
MPHDATRAALVEILNRVLPAALPAGWPEGRPLAEAGLDSVGVLALVDEIEARFGFRLADDELVAENFETLEGLVRLVTRRRPA